MNIGSGIIILRKERNLTQIQLANALSISQTYLSQLELNKKKPSLDLLQKISDYLEVPLYYLIFKSVDLADIKSDKKEIHQQISPVIDSLMQSLIRLDKIKSE